jgi:hypothetical protein
LLLTNQQPIQARKLTPKPAQLHESLKDEISTDHATGLSPGGIICIMLTSNLIRQK